MKLERLVLENFRQFKGRQELVFSDLRERNVTVVHAENGFGKTTLLNALLWVLYGAKGLTDDFPKPDSLIHEGLAQYAKDPHAILASVELTFSHENERYILERTLTLAEQRHDARRPRVSLHAIREGQPFPLDNPDRRIQAIAPAGIAPLLFFNGEGIDHLAMERNRGRVVEAIHRMLGLSLLQTTIDDLQHPSVLGRLRRELKDNTSDEKRNLLAELEKAEERERSILEREEQETANLKATEAEMAAIDHKLEANRTAHELQTRRLRLLDELHKLRGQRDEVARDLSQIVAEDGYTLFTSELVNRGKEIMGDLRKRNMIPAPVIDSYLQKLLDSERCLCERHLPPGSPEFEAVRQRLSVAPNQDFNNAVSAIDNAIGLFEGVAARTREEIRRLNARRLELSLEIRNREEEEAEIHQKLGGKEDEEVQSLESARLKHKVAKESLAKRLWDIGHDLARERERIGKIKEQISALLDLQEQAARAQRRIDATELCIRTLAEILAAETEELRPLLNEEIDRHFRKIIDREYWAVLDQDFTLRIRKRVPGHNEGVEPAEIDVALSTGQRQVTSLVFIASLLALARRRSEIPTILRGLSGSEYPLVTDSPFGQLSIFRHGVAKWVSELAPQVVLLLSPKQYEGDVATALRESGRIGKRYFLSYYGPSLPERAQPHLNVDDRPHQQYFDHPEEFTRIEEI